MVTLSIAGGELTFGDATLSGVNATRTHTGVSDARVTLPRTDELIPYVQREARATLSDSNGEFFTGYLVGYQGDRQSGSWTLRIDGVAKRLEETRPDYGSVGGPVTYTNIALDKAIADYWTRTPFNATVTSQTPELIAEDEPLQSADTTSEWQTLLTPADSDPLTIANGSLQLEQTSWTREGEAADSDNVNVNNSGDYSDGGALIFLDVGDFAEWTFTPGYDIPAGDFRIHYRNEGDSPGVDIEWTVNGTAVETTNNPLSLNWNTVNADELGELTAGNAVTVRAEVVSDPGGNRRIDVIAPVDNRFNYTFDNDNGGSGGYLDSPQLYPDYQVELPTVLTAYNIPSATIDSTWNDTTGNQAISASNDNGATFLTSTNTSTDTFDFASAGRQAVARFTLSGGGTRTTATPQTGFVGQEVQDYALTADLNDLVVIDKLELSRSHFENLKTLHNYGDFLWVIEHASGALGDMTVRSFIRGEETRPAPDAFDNFANLQPEVAAENYFNSVYLEGELQPDGTRPTAEISDSDAVASDGREIQPGVLRDQNISTESGAQFRANALLQAALANNALRGTATTPAVMTAPGYARPIDFGEGTDEKTVESVSITRGSDSAEATFEFVTREALSETISNLRRNARDIGNQV